MLPKERKIGARTRISYIISKGRRERFRLFSVTYLPGKGHFHRFAVAVSSKVAKTAVGRNHLRRQIYEAIRLKEEEGASLPKNEKPCYDVVVFASHPIRTASYSAIQKEVENLFYKLSTL